MADWILSVLMLAGAALLAGAVYIFRNGEKRQQAWLMLAAALVMFANVAIWSVPIPENSTSTE